MSLYSDLDAELGKYSYPIFVFEGNVQHAATAFFYRTDNTTFLVSNYHSIKGMSPMHNRLNFSSDTLYLKYQFPNSSEHIVVEIDIGEKTIGKTEIFYMADGIDLLKIPVNIPANYQVNFINELIDKSYFNRIPKRVYIFGYPNPKSIEEILWSKLTKFEGIYSKNGFDDFYNATLKAYPRFQEKDKMFSMMSFYYFITPVIDLGYSGSPVIGEFESTEEGNVYKFIGVNFGNEPFSNQTWIIRGDIAFEYLNS